MAGTAGGACNHRKGTMIVSTVTTKDGIEIFYKDWGQRPADRVPPRLAAELRRLGRADAVLRAARATASSPTTGAATAARRSRRTGTTWTTYAADAAAVVEHLDLRDAVHVGHSTGGGEVARYVARHGQGRVAKAVLIGAVPPIMVKTPANPGGLPIEVFDGFRDSLGRQPRPVLSRSSRPGRSTASTGRARRSRRA